jgi:glycerate 2-kinase
VTAADERRQMLLELLQAALIEVDGRRCTRLALEQNALAAGPSVGSTPSSVRTGKPFVYIAAIGKAASAMALGARDAFRESIRRVLLITKDGHVSPEAADWPVVRIHLSSHPVPDARSLEAGESLLAWLDEVPPDARLVFLISGGASSLVEVLPRGVGLEDLRRLNAEGLASGITIEELNTRRCEMSLLKGGQLAARLHGRPARALFISDVPGDDPAVIGSGLLGPAIHGDDRIEREVIASVDHAVRAVCSAAQARGLPAERAAARFDGEAWLLGEIFVRELRDGSPGIHVWGGESVVRLPANPGRGGRNQHLALAAARAIAGDPELLLLAAGTDGTDGPTEDAGALVDGDSWMRIADAGIDGDVCLTRADAGTALDAAGDLVHTGPTGTNVGDIVIGWKGQVRCAS